MKHLLLAVIAFALSLPSAFLAVLLATVALLACYLSARRAMNVDPLVALRYE